MKGASIWVNGRMKLNTDIHLRVHAVKEEQGIIMKNDVINRQEAIEDAKTWVAVDDHERRLKKDVIEWLEKFSPAQCKTSEWIPVTERLPEEPNMYTVTDSKGNVVRFVYTGTDSSREYWLRCAKAWMPLPKPYEGECEE